ncbi:MAG: class II aldolase/adducin family protein [Anaerolineaceae bacterium]|nr:class II aldolase/adducin family protein [Anaerolineaceae bacterium]
MSSRFLISLDLGGSGGKALVYDIQKNQYTLSTCSWQLPPAPEAGSYAYNLGWSERWQELCVITREALQRAGAKPGEVAGISVSSMRHGLVLINKEGVPLLAVPNKDARAISESMDLQGERGDEVYRISGHVPSPVLMAPRLIYIKNNHPDLLAQTYKVLTISDWMAYMLCQVAVSEPTQAGETCLFDLAKNDWAWGLIDELGLPKSIFPRIVKTGEKIGTLSPKAAEELGLQAGIPIAAGGADTQLGLLGLGIVGPGEIGIIAGSTTPVMVTTSSPVLDPNKRTWTGMHAIPNAYVVESNAGAMGTTLEWMAGILYADSPAPVAALAGDAQHSVPGASGVISTLGSQIFNASSLGLPVDGLTFSSMTVPSGPNGRSHLARAVLEGMAFGTRANADQAQAVSGVKLQSVHAGGGMTRSKLLQQIIADVYNLPLHCDGGQQTSAFGAVICAAFGAGLYPSLTKAAEEMTKGLMDIKPDRYADQYLELYKTWRGHLDQRAGADAVATDSIMQAMQLASESEESDRDVTFRPRIYVSANAGQEAIQMLEKLGEVKYESYSESGTLLEGDEMVDAIAGYQVLVTEVDMVSAGVLQRAKDLRVVVACRGNPVNVDIPACTAAGVPVINTPGRNADAVADLAVSFMLMLVRKLDKATDFLRQPGGEAGDMGRMGQAYFTLKANELWHKTVGVIGGGAIGRKVVRRLLPFDVNCLIYDPYLSAEEAALFGAIKVDLDELLSKSDIVSLHAPVTDETTGLINASAFDRMKPGAYLVNTARAALVDHDALLDCLKSGKLGGVALDVFPVEPPGSDDPIFAFENVIATPHIGGNTSEVGIHQGEIIVDELKRLLRGEPPKYILNPVTFAGFRWSGERKLDQAALAERAKGPGPGMTDLDLKARQEEASTSNMEEKPKGGGLLGSLKKLIGGKEKEAASQEVISSEMSVPGGISTAEKHYAAILEKFLSDLSIDEKAQTFAKTNKVSFQFVLKNTSILFFMGFAGGKVDAGMGEAPFKPDVTVKLDADTFDGMFTGRVDGRKAFSEGRLSVGGNMLKAMAMQKLDFGPVYVAARDKMGGAGDLSTLGAQQPAAVQVTSAQVVASIPPVPPTSAPNFDTFNRVIERYVQLMNKDAETQSFAKGKNVTFLYQIKDAGTQFYTSFVDGNVTCGMGEAPMKVDVTIKTDAATLDGMFSGRLDGTAAFKSGKLSVGGNMMKAMVMQKLNFGGLYKQAVSEVGDPGLSGAVAPSLPTTPQASTSAQPSVSGTTPVASVPAVIHKTGDIRDTILEINNELYAKGMITFTGGNISARTDDNPNELWITPSGLNKASLRADMMVRIDLDGNIIGGAQFNASSERRVHCAIYQDRPDVKAVVHAHAMYSTLMALTKTPWQPISADACFFGQIPVVPFIMPGTPELGDEVGKAMGKKGFAAIMNNHGLVVAGSDLRRAADMTEMIELVAHKLIICRQLGVDPETIPDEIASMLGEMGSMVV